MPNIVYDCPICKGITFEGCSTCGGLGHFTMDEIKQIMIDAKVVDRIVPDKAYLTKKILEAAIKQGESGKYDLTDNPYDYSSQKHEWRTWNQGFTRGAAQASKATSAMKGKRILWRKRPGESRHK